jgi:outer membrane lipoprotein-sorting protein
MVRVSARLVRLCCAFLLAVLPEGAPLANAEAVVRLKVDFVQHTEQATGDSAVEGTLYFSAPGRVMLEISMPVHQITVFQEDTLLVYYPEERRAFRFVSRNMLFVPFAESFLGVLKQDFGLAEAGFEIAGRGEAAGTLVLRWAPPKALRRRIGEVRTGHRDGRPWRIEVFDPAGRLLTQVTYAGFVTVDGLPVPTDIAVLEQQGKDRVVSSYEYRQPEVNGAFPESISGFRIPADVEVREMQW